ncbi:MAG TPA: hypothetical protein VEC19_16625 [Usitatibacter sp.]|nr:hypothetical protein [Usitatibacter sp.]
MESHSQQQPSLTDYIAARAWLKHTPNAFFPTDSSLRYFIKQHEAELIKCGAFIPALGSAGPLVHPAKLAQAAIAIRLREAEERSRRRSSPGEASAATAP